MSPTRLAEVLINKGTIPSPVKDASNKPSKLSTTALGMLEMIREIGNRLYSGEEAVTSLLGLAKHMKWYDRDEDGYLNEQEFSAALRALGGLSDADLIHLFDHLDYQQIRLVCLRTLHLRSPLSSSPTAPHATVCGVVRCPKRT